MQSSQLQDLSRALEAAHEYAHHSSFDGCDAGDIDEVIDSAKKELQKPHPSKQTLSTYLNSVARSLRADESAREICMRLDSAMRAADVPTHWEEI